MKKRHPNSTTCTPYGGVTHRVVCFDCRVCFHIKHSRMSPLPCPNCKGDLADLGVHFRAPRKNNIRAWNMMFKMYKTGIWFTTHGGQGILPTNTSEFKTWHRQRYTRKFNSTVLQILENAK